MDSSAVEARSKKREDPTLNEEKQLMPKEEAALYINLKEPRSKEGRGLETGKKRKMFPNYKSRRVILGYRHFCLLKKKVGKMKGM